MFDKFRDVPRHSLAKARELNAKYYWSDEPCKHGHVFFRCVSNYRCVMCRNQPVKQSIVGRRIKANAEAIGVNGDIRRKIEDKLEELRLCKLTDY